MSRVHLIELPGFGGNFQHAVRLGQIFLEVGVSVTLHTAPRHEPADLGGIALCGCSPWRPQARASHRRELEILARYVGLTLPHLVRSVGRGEVAHLQMTPSVLVTALTVSAMRAAGRPLAFSPHNTFARHGGSLKLQAVKLPIRLCGATIAFSDREAAVLASWKGRVVRSPLVHIVPAPAPARVERFRGAWGARDGRETVLFAGQIRRDKRLDLLIESATGWPPHRTLVVVGEDRGDWERCRAIAERLGVRLHATLGFQPLEDLVAAIAAADVVVAPYDRASQSGVLLLAGELGVRTIAADLGGLAEQADSTFPAEDVDALTAAVDASLRRPAQARRPADVARAREAHLAAYALAREHARR